MFYNNIAVKKFLERTLIIRHQAREINYNKGKLNIIVKDKKRAFKARHTNEKKFSSGLSRSARVNRNLRTGVDLSVLGPNSRPYK